MKTIRFNGKSIKKQADINLLILDPKDFKNQNLEILIDFNTENPITIPGFEDFKAFHNDLTMAAEHLVLEIKNNCKREELAKLMINPENGLATSGYSTLNAILPKETQDDFLLVEGQNHIPLIEINCNYFLIPWEWLFDLSPIKIRKNGTLNELVKHFWGYKYIISRRTVTGVKRNIKKDNINQKPKIKIGLLFDENLGFAIEEKNWLLENYENNLIDLEIAEIDKTKEEWKRIQTICNFLNKKDVDIFHFACDSVVDPKYQLNSYLHIGNTKFRVKHFNSNDDKVNLYRQTIFLNACSTTTRNPLQTFDFVNLFLKAGASNVIALESSVESRVAKNYAMLFYSKLLSGCDLGRSLIEARREILNTGQSSADIVTLFYSLYGDPNSINQLTLNQ